MGGQAVRGAQPLKLKHFNRTTGAFLPDKAADTGFTPKNGPGAWETAARAAVARARANGYLDFEDVRDWVATRLRDKAFSARLGAALSGRFREIVVDEAQDCNLADLEIIEWLRASGIKVKVVCDPNQAIYAFRGGLTDELMKFAQSFLGDDQLSMSGNFRSSPAICAAISQLRPPQRAALPTRPWGSTRTTPRRSTSCPTAAPEFPPQSAHGSKLWQRP